ncbi:MAG TPA: CBS domain-containing protein [Candidatus Binatia bacterium]
MKANSMKVFDVMSKDPLTVSPSDTVGQAEELMYENHYRQLPVVENKQLIGIVTDRDIRSFLAHSSLLEPEKRGRALRTKVTDIMTTKPLTVSPEEDLREAVELLIEEKIGGIPVIDEAQGLVGIVTYVDVLRVFLNRLEDEQA